MSHTVTQRGASWQATVYHPSLPGGRARRQFRDRLDALAWAVDTEKRAGNGDAPLANGGGSKGLPRTMGDLREYTIRHHWSTTRTLADAEANSRIVVDIIGASTPIRSVTRVTIDNVRTTLVRRGMAAGTVNRKLAALSRMLRVAEELELIPRKPTIGLLREPEGRIWRLTAEIERDMLAWAKEFSSVEFHDYLVLSLDTGLRQGELLNIPLIHWSEERVYVPGEMSKTLSPRNVPLTTRARSSVVIKRLMRAEGFDRPILWPMSKRVVHLEWGKMRTALGLDDQPAFVPHILRHEFCSRLADAGVNAYTIMTLAGHANLETSQRYVHKSQSSLMEAIEHLDIRSRGDVAKLNATMPA